MVVDHSAGPFLEGRETEIHQQTQAQIHQAQIGEKLLRVNRCVPLDRLDLDQELVFDKQVEPEPIFNKDTVVLDVYRLLARHLQSASPKAFEHQSFVDAFKQAGAKV